MRVVVTGFGALTPLGSTREELIKAMREEKCAIDEISRYPIDDREVTLAAELKDYDAEKEFSRKELNRLDRVNQYALVAARRAMEDAKISREEIGNRRVGVYITSGIGGLGTIEEDYQRGMKRSFDKLSPYFIPKAIINSVGANVAIDIGAHGACLSMVTACASSTNSIGEAYRAIKNGYEEIIFAGGSEASITYLGVGGFTSMKALSSSKDKNRASIPFDKDRNGFVMGEGAGLIVIESLEHALARGATPLAELVGYGTSADAYHLTAGPEDGDGARRAMEMAIRQAGISAEEIDHINAHATSTQVGDKGELAAIKKLFGAHPVAITSTKSATGHLLGAAGGIEAIFTIQALRDQMVPPTLNLHHPDENAEGLNLVALVARPQKMRYALSNGFGFGGVNASLLLKRW